MNTDIILKVSTVRKICIDCAQLLKPIARDNLSDWADKHFCLSAESSHKAGKWQTYPFQLGWMDAFSNDNIEEVVVRKSRRVGYTKTLLAFIAYNAVCRRRNQAMWWPTDTDRTRFVRDELDPMIRDVEVVNNILYKTQMDDTTSRKKFHGSVLNVLGGKTPRAYRGLTIDVAMLDEISAFDLNIGNAISPREAVKGRLEGAPNPKMVIGSTPRIRGTDHVDHIASQCKAIMTYHIPCIHCHKFHELDFGDKDKPYGFKGYKLANDSQGKVKHYCPHCFKFITQDQYFDIYHKGNWVSKDNEYIYTHDRRWIDKNGNKVKPPKSVAFTIWSGYSPQRSWESIIDEWLDALNAEKIGDLGPLKVFVNETLGQSWEDRHQKTDVHSLTSKISEYDRFTVPNDGLILCTGIDTQQDRWEALTWAYGKDGKMFCVDYSVLRGNPADLDSWDQVLDSYLQTEFTHESGKIMKISATAIDVLGHFTTNAYMYCRLREHKRIFAVRGGLEARITTIKVSSSQQDIDYMGRKIRNGVRLWNVGTNVAKDLFFQRCSLPEKVFFYRNIDPVVFEGLCSEKRILVQTKRYKMYRWVNMYGRRNEALDCTVYSIFAADMLSLLHQRPELWDRYYKKFVANSEKVKDKKPVNESDISYIQHLRNRNVLNNINKNIIW